MSSLLVFDASGSMAGEPTRQCALHASRSFAPETPALVDTGGADTGGGVIHTTLRHVLDDRNYGAGNAVGPRMLRECALIHDDVHFYTDGFLGVGETAVMPKGRVTVHLWGNPDQGIISSISRIIIENATVETIGAQL